MAGPWVLVGLPLVAAPLAYFVRRWAFLGALLAGGVSAGLAWLCFAGSLDDPVTLLGFSLSLGQPVSVLGRELMLIPAGQVALGFLFAVAGASFLLAWPVSPGRSFFPLGLIVLSGWAAAVLMQHFAFAVIILWLTSTLATMVIQGGRLASTRGAGLQMIVLTLAAPLLLLVSTLVEARAVNPDDFTLAQPAILLTAIGLAGLFAAFPFQGWVSAMVANAQPGVVAFLVSGYPVVTLMLALNLFHDQPWLVADGQVLSWLAWGGWLAAAVGGLLAAAQRHFAPLLGYTLLNDLGFGVIALAMPGETGLTTAFLMIAARAVGALLAGAGLAVVRQRVGRTAFFHLKGLGRRLPVASASLLLGGFSLAGVPLTAGFVARWALLGQAAPNGEPWLWVLLLSSLGVALGWLRGARALLMPEPAADEAASPLRRMPLVACVMVVLLAAICLWMGRWPGETLAWLRPLVETYAPLIATPALTALP